VFGHSSPRTRYLLSINEETVGGYCELLWRKGVGDAASPPLCGPDGLSHAEQCKEWYRKNRERHLANTNARHARARGAIRQFVAEYLLDHPCVDCGESDPIVLDFDHIGEKSFGISSAIARSMSLDKVQAEIAKCEVRCANCHRRKTHRTFGYQTRFLTKESALSQARPAVAIAGERK
jgi:5-methylcytosine-specific restriction endonuclease McrA